METDVLIVGGGPAGLAAAIALRQRGLDCTVVEARGPGIDKACGEGLMPGAIDALALLGVRVTAADGYGFKGISFVGQRDRVAASFQDGIGIGVRRPQLHEMMRQRAEAVGAELRWESRVELVSRSSATIDGKPIRFSWLVGADGYASTVRRWAGLDRVCSESVRYGFRRHLNVRPWSEFVEIYWGRRGQIYVTPVGPECVGVVYIARDAKALREDALGEFPELAERLGGAALASRERGAVSATKTLWRVARGNVALIGDASGSVDAITGEGLAISFRQALALADGIAAGSFAGYQREHRRIARLPHAMSGLMLAMDRWPGLQARALHALAANPEMLSELLAVHVGHKSPIEFALTRGPKLGWKLARA